MLVIECSEEQLNVELEKGYNDMLEGRTTAAHKVFDEIENFAEREQILRLRNKVLQAEQERINGKKTMSIAEAKRMLRK